MSFFEMPRSAAGGLFRESILTRNISRKNKIHRLYKGFQLCPQQRVVLFDRDVPEDKTLKLMQYHLKLIRLESVAKTKCFSRTVAVSELV